MKRVRQRQRGQAVVEFGLLALLFTLMLFAIVDYGLLLNTWLSVSSSSRELAREASVGMRWQTLEDHAEALSLPGVSRFDSNFPGGYCCDPSDNVRVTVRYYNPCPSAGPLDCGQVPNGQLDNRYGNPQGGCSATPSSPCPHPAAGDTVVLTVQAAGAQVVTPLVRPFFGCSGIQAVCYVPVNSTTTMRFEGQLQ